MKAKTSRRRKKSKRPMMIIMALMIIISLIIGAVMTFKAHYNNPSLIGKWISEETGKVVEFTEDGVLIVDELKTGKYILESPQVMIYEVEGYTFEMEYHINQRSLVWGLPEEKEKFERKGI